MVSTFFLPAFKILFLKFFIAFKLLRWVRNSWGHWFEEGAWLRLSFTDLLLFLDFLVCSTSISGRFREHRVLMVTSGSIMAFISRCTSMRNLNTPFKVRSFMFIAWCTSVFQGLLSLPDIKTVTKPSCKLWDKTIILRCVLPYWRVPMWFFLKNFPQCATDPNVILQPINYCIYIKRLEKIWVIVQN